MSAPDNQSFCADLVRARDFTAYAASLFVPDGPDAAEILAALEFFADSLMATVQIAPEEAA